MILRRLGNKSQLAESIYKTFPKHDIYMEPFFGTGAVFFKKPRANHNFINDIDDDVYNLWNVYTNQYDKLLEAIECMPKSESLYKNWMTKKETDPILKALRLLFLSNFSYMGKGDCFKFGAENQKSILIKYYKSYIDSLKETYIGNSDFREFFSKIAWNSFFKINSFKAVCYADPPYLGTTDNYSHSFKEQDSIDLFDILQSKSKEFPNRFFYAISEFNHPFILEQAKQRNLNIIDLGERQTMKNRNTEILITNYENELSLFDSLGGASNSKSSLAFV